MIKVAVTGGIGSGKSTVCSVFKKIGIPIFDADFCAKKIINENSSVREQLITLFGKDIYHENGTIHRKKLAHFIFNDKIALQKVNEIVHPLVHSEFNQWATFQKSNYVIQETAIVFENNNTQLFDKIIAVIAPMELKIKRCIERDKVSRELIEERMKNQLSDEYKASKADYIIVNDDIEMVLPQILLIHQKLK